MLIEPVGVGHRGRGARARTVTAIAAPFILLLAVVATGAMARPAATLADIGVSSPPASAASTTAPRASPTLGDDDAGVTIAIPSRVLGLPARAVRDAVADRRAGVTGDALIAIRGYLTIWPVLADCIDTLPSPSTDPAWRCERRAVLRDDPTPVLTDASGSPVWRGVDGGPHLHPTIFPGVSMGAADPAPTGSGDAAGPGERGGESVRAVPVIVIGRFDDARLADRRASARHVNEGFVIERLAWADGRWQDLRFARFVPYAVNDLDVRTARALTAEALPGGTVILSQNIVRPGMLAGLSLDASAAVRGLVPASTDRLWFVRAMTRTTPTITALADAVGPRRLGWVVLANDGTILALDRDG